MDKNLVFNKLIKILIFINEYFEYWEWFVINCLMIVDIVIFFYIVLVYEGGVDILNYNNIYCWMNNIKVLDGFLIMLGI